MVDKTIRACQVCDADLSIMFNTDAIALQNLRRIGD
jgi:hypothetical protein